MAEDRPRCFNCRFRGRSGYPYIECHRHAPSVDTQTDWGGHPSNRCCVKALWPIVHVAFWCGDWEGELPGKEDGGA